MTAHSEKGGRRWRRRADARPDEVLDAALDLFLAHGFAATRVEDIARRAGLSKGAVYLYFSGKEAILEALVRRSIVPLVENAVAMAADHHGTPREALESVVRAIAQRFSDPRLAVVPRLVLSESGNFPELALMYRREVLAPATAALERLIAGGTAAGAFRPVDPELAVRNVVGPIIAHLLLGVIFGHLPKGGLDFPAFVESHLDILINGLAPRPEEG